MPAVSDGKHIDAFIPPHLRDMFYRHPTRPYAWNNGLDPYGFSTDGLVLYLPLWALKPSTFKSVDAYEQTCTVTGALWQPNGRVFDGDDIIKILADSGIGPGTKDFTIELWFNTSTAGDRAFCGGDVDATHRIYSRLEDPDAELFLYFQTANAPGEGLFGSSVANGFDDGAWHHLIITYDRSGNMVGYIDTTSILTVDISSVEADDIGNLPMVVGARNNAGASDFIGTLGEFRFYTDRLLSTQDIAHNYTTTLWRYQ